MRIGFIFFAFILCFQPVSAQVYLPIDNGSKVSFVVNNFGIPVTGILSGLSGKIFFNPEDVSASQISVSVNTTTINTNNKARDKHLQKEDYFHVEKYPKISFLSKQIKAEGARQYTVTGTLTIKGIEKDISFPFSVIQEQEGYLFNGVFRINRRDFKVGGKSLILSDQLSVNLSVLVKKTNP